MSALTSHQSISIKILCFLYLTSKFILVYNPLKMKWNIFVLCFLTFCVINSECGPFSGWFSSGNTKPVSSEVSSNSSSNSTGSYLSGIFGGLFGRNKRPGPYCQEAAQFAFDDRNSRNSIRSFQIVSCDETRKEFYTLTLNLFYMNGSRTSCTGIVVWVRPFKEQKYTITNSGQCKPF